MVKNEFTFDVDVASVPVSIHIDDSFKEIKKLLSQFPSTNKNSLINIRITLGDSNEVRFDRENKTLEIKGPSINNLSDPFNTIGIFQAIFRFISFYSPDNEIFLIHGSAARLGGKTICFGDDGESMGKTLGSVICAAESGEYLADEFVFLDANSFEIFGYPFVPIHLRTPVKKHLANNKGLKMPRSKYKEGESGYFVDTEQLFKFINKSRLDAFAFVYFVEDKPKLKKLLVADSNKALLASLLAHQMKLIHPELDRMRFTKQTDSGIEVEHDEPSIGLLATEILQNDTLGKITHNIPCYRLLINSPGDIIDLLSNLP